MGHKRKKNNLSAADLAVMAAKAKIDRLAEAGEVDKLSDLGQYFFMRFEAAAFIRVGDCYGPE